MILQTARLTLRPLAMTDTPALFAILGDGEAMRFWHRPPLPRLATVEALLADELAAMAAGGFLYWTVVTDGDAIGGVDLSHIEGGQAELGFLLRRDRWGQGFAREAVAAVMDHAFGPMALGRLAARIQSDNIRAARLVTALGFQKERVLPDVPREDGSRACALYGLQISASQNGA